MQILRSIGLCLLLGYLVAGPGTALAQTKEVYINGHLFQFSERKTEVEYPIREVVVSRISNGQKRMLLRHLLEQGVADCNSYTVELGDYLIGDTTITFYTAWTFGGETNFPIGVRKQVYGVAASGKVSRLSGEITLLHDVPPCFKDLGSYLDAEENPNRDRKVAWRLFFDCFEKEYQARWVDGKRGQSLLAEVRGVLGGKLQAQYQYFPKLVRL